MVSPSSVPFNLEPSVSNHFSWLNTQMSLQRTLMSAVRTSISLIGFGFTVAQFFEKLMANTPDAFRRLSPAAPRNFGLLLIAAGVISLIVFTRQYHSARRYLSSGPYMALMGDVQERMRGSAYLTAFAVLLIGFAAFSSILLRF